MQQYDAIVVGAGAAGSTAARVLAQEKGMRVLVIDRRSHIAGNCYDETDEYGVLIHKYGPHIFHTNDEDVYRFLSGFTEWHSFTHTVDASIDGKLVPVPFNLNSLRIVFDEQRADRIRGKLVSRYGMEQRVPILTLMKEDDEDLRDAGKYVYDNIYLNYTMKQWGKKPEEIDPAVTARVPVVVTDRNAYFPADKYQGVPLHGFTMMFRRMLDAPGITVRLNTEAADLLVFDNGKVLLKDSCDEFKGILVYTGAIDELFGLRYGRLPYRTLRFAFEHYGTDSYQGRSVVNYTVSEDYTRITEYKYLTGQTVDGTTISKEYPSQYTGASGEIPYYAIAGDDSLLLYGKYKEMADQYSNMRLLGRLAEFKYYNIDKIVGESMKMAEAAEKRSRES